MENQQISVLRRIGSFIIKTLLTIAKAILYAAGVTCIITLTVFVEKLIIVKGGTPSVTFFAALKNYGTMLLQYAIHFDNLYWLAASIFLPLVVGISAERGDVTYVPDKHHGRMGIAVGIG
jgi:hypothetical protein